MTLQEHLLALDELRTADDYWLSSWRKEYSFDPIRFDRGYPETDVVLDLGEVAETPESDMRSASLRNALDYGDSQSDSVDGGESKTDYMNVLKSEVQNEIQNVTRSEFREQYTNIARDEWAVKNTDKMLYLNGGLGQAWREATWAQTDNTSVMQGTGWPGNDSSAHASMHEQNIAAAVDDADGDARINADMNAAANSAANGAVHAILASHAKSNARINAASNATASMTHVKQEVPCDAALMNDFGMLDTAFTTNDSISAGYWDTHAVASSMEAFAPSFVTSPTDAAFASSHASVASADAAAIHHHRMRSHHPNFARALSQPHVSSSNMACRAPAPTLDGASDALGAFGSAGSFGGFGSFGSFGVSSGFCSFGGFGAGAGARAGASVSASASAAATTTSLPKHTLLSTLPHVAHNMGWPVVGAEALTTKRDKHRASTLLHHAAAGLDSSAHPASTNARRSLQGGNYTLRRQSTHSDHSGASPCTREEMPLTCMSALSRWAAHCSQHKHVRPPQETMVCAHCEGRFDDVLEYLTHLDTERVKHENFCPDPQCAFAVVGFRFRWLLRRHICNHHLKEYNSESGKGTPLPTSGLVRRFLSHVYVCEERDCLRAFYRLDSLLRHLRLIHGPRKRVHR